MWQYSPDCWPEKKGTKANDAEDADEEAGRAEDAGGPALDDPEPDIEQEEPADDLNQPGVETPPGFVSPSPDREQEQEQAAESDLPFPGFIERTADSPGPFQHSDDLFKKQPAPDSPGSVRSSDDVVFNTPRPGSLGPVHSSDDGDMRSRQSSKSRYPSCLKHRARVYARGDKSRRLTGFPLAFDPAALSQHSVQRKRTLSESQSSPVRPLKMGQHPDLATLWEDVIAQQESHHSPPALHLGSVVTMLSRLASPTLGFVDPTLLSQALNNNGSEAAKSRIHAMLTTNSIRRVCVLFRQEPQCQDIQLYFWESPTLMKVRLHSDVVIDDVTAKVSRLIDLLRRPRTAAGEPMVPPITVMLEPVSLPSSPLPSPG